MGHSRPVTGLLYLLHFTFYILHLLLERKVLELTALLEVRSRIYVWIETKASEGSKQWSEEYSQVWEVVFGVELFC